MVLIFFCVQDVTDCKIWIILNTNIPVITYIYIRDVSDVEFQTSARVDVYADVILRMQMWMRISVSSKMRMGISKYDILVDVDADVFYVKRSHQ